MSRRHQPHRRSSGGNSDGSKHSLTVIDRNKRDGVRHRHPHQPVCRCGWEGIPMRDKGRAEQQYRDHLPVQNRGAAKRTGAAGDSAHGWKPLTPQHLLPEALRMPPRAG